MASEGDKRPKKGILKTSSSFDTDGQNDVPSNKQAKWDEMNILATYHPADKDYGHMKIDEPPTPYNHESGGDGEADEEMAPIEGQSQIDPENLADRLKGSTEPKVMEKLVVESISSDEDLNETEEERAKRKVFEQKRKLHYNEFQAVKLARQLLAEEDDDDDDEGEKSADKDDDGDNL